MTMLSPSETVYLAFVELRVLMHMVTDHIYWIEGILYIVGERNIIHKCKSRV